MEGRSILDFWIFDFGFGGVRLVFSRLQRPVESRAADFRQAGRCRPARAAAPLLIGRRIHSGISGIMQKQDAVFWRKALCGNENGA